VVKPSHIFEERGIAKSNFYDQSFWMDGTRTETLFWILEQKQALYTKFNENLKKSISTRVSPVGNCLWMVVIIDNGNRCQYGCLNEFKRFTTIHSIEKWLHLLCKIFARLAELELKTSMRFVLKDKEKLFSFCKNSRILRSRDPSVVTLRNFFIIVFCF
jgi:hypothetical protein